MFKKDVRGHGTIKKLRTGAVVSVLALFVAGISGVASAEEVSTTQIGADVVGATAMDGGISAPTTEVVPTKAVSAEQVNTAKVEANQAIQAVSTQETVVAEVERAITANDATVKDLNNQIQEVNTVTPQVVEQAKADETKAQENLATANSAVDSAEANLASTISKVEAQEGVVADAQAKATETAQALESAKAYVEVAQKAIDSTGLSASLDEQAELTKQVEESAKQVISLEVSLGKVTDKLESSRGSAESTRKQLEQNISDAGGEYITEVVSHEVATHEVANSNTKTSPNKQSTFVGSNGKTYYTVANEDVDFAGERTETIVVDDKLLKGKTVDYTKVAKYMREYLVELRRINGIDIPVPEVTEKALAWANARAKEMDSNNELSHDTTLKYSDFGLVSDTENASAGSMSTVSSRDEKEIAYNELLRYFNDYSNANSYGTEDPKAANVVNYGHRIPLLAASGAGMAVGASGGYSVLTFVSDTKEGVYSVMPSVIDPSTRWSYEFRGETHYRDQPNSYFLAKAVNEDGDTQHSEFYYNGKRVKFLPKTTFKYVWNETVTHKNEKFESATKALDDFNKEQAVAEDTLTKEISSLSSRLSKAKQTATDTNNALTKVNELVNSLTASEGEKAEKLKVAKAELEKAEIANSQALGGVTKEKETLEGLTKAREVAGMALTDAKAKQATAKTVFDTASAKASDLASKLAKKEAILAELETTLSDATSQASLLRAELETARESLAALKADADSKQAEYLRLATLKAEQDKSEADAKRLQDLKAKADAIIKDGGQLVQVVDKDGNLVDVVDGSKATQSGEDVTINGKNYTVNPDGTVTEIVTPQKTEISSTGVSNSAKSGVVTSTKVTKQAGVTQVGNEVTYSRVERAKVLPNTGSQESLLGLLGASMLLGLGFVGKRTR